MPRTNELRNYDAFGNLVNPNVNSHSVLDINHPANNPDNRPHDEGRDYIFRQRIVNPLKLTLGWELEANHVPSIVPNGVNHISDGSVNGDGAEFIVLPAVTKSPRYVLGLLKGLVHSPKLNTDNSCGFHVHVSTSNLILPKMRQWALATEHLALQIEDLAFKAVPDSRRDNNYCRRISPIRNGARFVSSKYSNERRYHWLNTVEMFRPNGIRTIENRLLGHTHRWKYVLAWALFTMELAQRGWDVANHPFVVQRHIDFLEGLLNRIITEIKPLDKRALPVPQWVYEGLSAHGIDQTTWDRPLSKLSETEYRLKGLVIPFYSDNQPEEPNRNDEEDEDSDCCPCGCGNDGACDDQLHSDGDCDNRYCSRCHDNGDCEGSPDCEQCRDSRHDDNENCGRAGCRTCLSRPRQSELDEIRNSTVTDIPSVTPPTATNMREAVNELLSSPGMSLSGVSGSSLQMNAYTVAYDALIFRSGMSSVAWDDTTHHSPIVYDNEIVEVNAAELERLAYERLDQHEIALTLDRNHQRGHSNVRIIRRNR